MAGLIYGQLSLAQLIIPGSQWWGIGIEFIITRAAGISFAGFTFQYKQTRDIYLVFVYPADQVMIIEAKPVIILILNRFINN